MKITNIIILVICLVNIKSCDLIRSNFFTTYDISSILDIVKLITFDVNSLVEQVVSIVGNVVNPILSTVGTVVRPIVSTVASAIEIADFSLVLNLLKAILPSWFRQKFPLGEILEMYLDYLKNPIAFSPVEPECNMDVPEMIRHLGYTAEVHNVITADGYILEIHRIPFGKKSWSMNLGEPVLLQHGLFASSVDWVNNLEHQSLAFVLADRGYDVWLGNIRGNVYSRNHVNSHMNIFNEKFWDFSWEEMAHFDLPSMIDYILKTTFKTKLTYIGHSMGTVMGFALFSTDINYSNKVKRFIALGPITSAQHIDSFAVKSLLPVFPLLSSVFKLIDWYYVLDSSAFLHFIAQSVCKGLALDPLCVGLLSVISGTETVTNFNRSRYSIYMSHFPSGASVKTLLHSAQTFNAKKFQQFDYGRTINMKKYNQETPPEYNLGNIKIPVSLFSGANDIFSTKKEADMIVSELPSHSVEFSLSVDDFTHLDLVWSIQANHLVYKKIIKLLELEEQQ